MKQAYRAGRVRVHRPWVTEPGMWLQYDFGDGPVIDGVKTVLFCAWLAWSRFRVVLPMRDKTVPSVFAALDVDVPAAGWGADVRADRQREDRHRRARRRDRGPQPAAGRRSPGTTAVTVHTCVPADPASKGGIGGRR